MSPPSTSPSSRDPRASEDIPPAETGPHTEEWVARRFLARLRMFAQRRVGHAETAEDIAQETLRRVLEALRKQRIRDMKALPAFVFQTARHVCLQHHRSSQRRLRALQRLVTRQSDPALRPDALTGLVTEERREAVRQALAELGDGDRELLQMVYYDQLDTDELTERLGITAAALRVRKHRALKRLATLLTESAGPVTESPDRQLQSDS